MRKETRNSERRWGLLPASSDREHDLTKEFSAEHMFLGRPGFLKRKRPVDHRLEQSLLGEIGEETHVGLDAGKAQLLPENAQRHRIDAEAAAFQSLAVFDLRVRGQKRRRIERQPPRDLGFSKDAIKELSAPDVTLDVRNERRLAVPPAGICAPATPKHPLRW